MNNFLRKVKIVDDLETEIEIDKSDFVNKLREHVDQGDTGALSDFFDMFSTSKNEFKGYVNNDGFKIKRKRRLFDMSSNLSTAEGTLTQDASLLRIKTEINAFNGFMIPFYILITVFYLIFISTFSLIAFSDQSNQIGIALPFVLIHAVFMYGAPYIMMRRSTRRMKHELEREFLYLTKK